MPKRNIEQAYVGINYTEREHPWYDDKDQKLSQYCVERFSTLDALLAEAQRFDFTGVQLARSDESGITDRSLSVGPYLAVRQLAENAACYDVTSFASLKEAAMTLKDHDWLRSRLVSETIRQTNLSVYRSLKNG